VVDEKNTEELPWDQDLAVGRRHIQRVSVHSMGKKSFHRPPESEKLVEDLVVDTAVLDLDNLDLGNLDLDNLNLESLRSS